MDASEGLEWLVRFGEAAERHDLVAIGVGGEIVLGATASGTYSPGKEAERNESGGAERPAGAPAGDGPETGPRTGQRAPSEAAARAPAHALRELTEEIRRRVGDWTGNGVTLEEFEELATYYPDVRVSASSSRFLYLTLTAIPFPTLGERFRLVYELLHPSLLSDLAHRPLYLRRHEWRGEIGLGPRENSFDFRSLRRPEELVDMVGGSLTRRVTPFRLPPRCETQLVPAVRAWARWESGPLWGALVVSHHRQPDLSICACMPHQWVRGRDRLVDFVGITVSWVGKVLHEQLLGWYAGRQHYPEWLRRERDRANEFCGCGGERRYEHCHRESDQEVPAERLRELEVASRIAYFSELRHEGRPVLPPATAWGGI